MRTRSLHFLLLAALIASCMVQPAQINPAAVTMNQATPSSEPTKGIGEEKSPTPTPAPTPTSETHPNVSGMKFGASYSFSHATWLCNGDFDCARRMLEDIACGLKPDGLRLMAPWDWLQDDSSASLKTAFNIDWQLQTATRCGVKKIIMAVGLKTPHYPEYKRPRWTIGLSEAELKASLLDYVQRFVKHYTADGRITHWQLENEVLQEGPTFGGKSPFTDAKAVFQEEINLIRDVDGLRRPIVGTESGDVGNWPAIAQFVDEVGVTHYRKSCGDGVSYFDHTERNGSPSSWAQRAESLKPKLVSLIELQWEPWPCGGSVKDVSPEEAEKTMNPQIAADNLQFVIEAGFKEVYLWGLEWCLYEKKRGRPQMWELTQKFFAQR